VKLLRALQEQRFTPVGANREVEVNVRIVAATNRNLEEMIKKGEFREDLFYRLNVLPLFLPPLRERKDDVAALIEHFLAKFSATYGNKVEGVSEEARELLMKYNWPGNIRELENVMEHAFVIESGSRISAASLPDSIRGLSRSVSKSALAGDNAPAGASAAEGDLSFAINLNNLDFQSQKEEFEKHFIISALKVFNGRINQTALHANIPKKTLLRKLEKYGLTAKDYQDDGAE
jgi:two-component system response regulator HydG